MRYERAKEVAIKSQKELEELRSSTLGTRVSYLSHTCNCKIDFSAFQ